MIVVVTGATGLVGQALTKKLLNEGYTVHALIRDLHKLPFAHKNLKVFKWEASRVPPAEALINSQALVHLAGESIAGGLWTSQRKEKLKSSRIKSCQNIIEAIRSISPAHRPKKFYTASAVGFYGSSLDETFTEDSPPGHDFLAQLCQEWEACARSSSGLGLSTTVMRFGLVLSNRGGILKKMGPFVFAGGRHWMSWIHIDDLVNFILFSLEKEDVQGEFNLCSHHPLIQRDFARILVKYLRFPTTIPVPHWALKLGLGEMSQTILASQKVLPKALDHVGFKFKFDSLDSALADLLSPRETK